MKEESSVEMKLTTRKGSVLSEYELDDLKAH